MNRIQILDKLSKKDSWSYYQLYNKTQWYSEEEMKNFQLEKLKSLLHHVNENVPYYAKIIKDKHININKVRGLEILNEFPIITKEIIKANYIDFTPRNINSIKFVKISQTSGTTGNILIKRNDQQTRSSTWGSYARFYDWMGINNYYEPSVLLSGGHIYGKSIKQSIKDWLTEFIQNSKRFNPYTLNDEYIDEIKEYFLSKKPSLIRGYSQAIFELAKRFEELNNSFNFKAITTTAEPLLDHHRELFRKVFNCEAFDQYGCGEIGGSAYECDHHNGLHITQERVIVEVDHENHLIVTDLDNYAMPFIRYRNDDQAILSDEKCSCGRQSPLIKKIMGRTCDIIYGKNGNKLHWAYFYHLMFETNIAVKRNMIKFQIEQKTEKDIIIRFVADKFSEEDKKILKNEVISIIGDMNVEIINVDDIPLAKSGKYRPIISKIAL
ncbi:MAG: phenylacetate--CoA ligase family protein [Candidatus Peribacteraceae bacterium]|nr:phenylacetate--CoA ligase family protein [Candidatus Peribacteraceae bacterium]